MTALLNVRDLSVAFDGRPRVVDGVSFDVGRGEIVALVGESGSGKTIAARALLGLLPGGAEIVGGSAHFERLDLLRLTENERQRIRGARIGLIFQEPMTSLNPSMRVGAQIAESLRLHRGVSEKAARALSIDMLARVRVPNPELALERFPHQFSGGMRQRLTIASVMLLQPALVLADEPTTALDVLVQKEVLDLLVELARDAGSGVLLITHDLGLVAEYAQRIVVMRHGRVVESGPCEELLARPRADYTSTLLGSLPSRTGRERQGKVGPTLVEAKNVAVSFGVRRQFSWRPASPVRSLDGVSLTIRKGETIAIVGESGSGKTTLARALLGLVPISSGSVQFDGLDMLALRGRALREARQRIRIVFQDPFSALDPRMRIGAIVGEGLRHERGLSTSEQTHRVARALDEVGLPDSHARFPHQLSGGQRQRVNIARALISDPELVIADEPVSALDVTVQAEVLRLLDRLQASRGFGCMFISHALGVVEQVADRIAVLHRGKVLEVGNRDDIFDRPHHPYTCALLRAAPRLERHAAGGYRLGRYPAVCMEPPPGFEFLPINAPSVGEQALVEVAAGHAVACVKTRS